MAENNGLQLLPETRKKITVNVPGENRLVYVGVGLLVLVLAAWGGLTFYQNSLSTKLAEADTQLVALEKQRDKEAEQNLITLSKQIGITNQVFKNHVYWSTGLSKVESALQGNLQFKSFSATADDGVFRLRALTNNYATIAKQLASFLTDDSIKDVSLEGVSTLTSGRLDFNAKITFDKTKFLKSK